MAAQLLAKIKHVTVRITLAEDRDESEYPGLQGETLAVGADQPFTRELGGAVQRGLHGKRRIFRCWNNRGCTVYRARGGECDLAYAVGTHRLEHIVRGDRVLLEVSARMLRAMAHVRVRREMEHTDGAPHRSS